MAGEQNSRQCNNIQDIVRAVVNNFNSSSTNSTSSGLAIASSTASTTVDSELNRCFQIPWGTQTFQPPVENQSDSRPSALATTNALSPHLQCAQPQTSHPNPQLILADNLILSGFLREQIMARLVHVELPDQDNLDRIVVAILVVFSRIGPTWVKYLQSQKCTIKPCFSSLASLEYCPKRKSQSWSYRKKLMCWCVGSW